MMPIFCLPKGKLESLGLKYRISESSQRRIEQRKFWGKKSTTITKPSKQNTVLLKDKVVLTMRETRGHL